ncbi:MerR family transcriptional regulator [Rhodococcus sp. PAM 2766]|uniref:MerR family transcriptional regulator n=1 Tax=Rhodococcus parequi TaxID=3137122 RepID=A0ABW9FHY0_9NOCA
MNAPGPDDLVTIGAFARATGLTPSALRFYDDSGLLAPAHIDPATGYRYYAAAQRARASTIRRLRAIDVPLDVVTRVLAADPDEASQLLDAHVRVLQERAADAAAEAEAVKAALALGRRHPRVALPGRLLADAVERVLPAVSEDPEFPVLTGIFVELSGAAVTVTATDRYRLSTRSLAVAGNASPWSAVLPARALAALVPWFAGSADLALERQDDTVVLSVDGEERRCAVLPGSFPDYAAMLAALPPASTRVVVARDELLGVVEGLPAGTIRCVVAPHGIAVGTSAGPERWLDARVTGPGPELFFRRDNLRSALVTAVGPDLMLDISAADMPVVIRSATDGDLTTLAMPTASGT